jgi:sodium bile acid symporter family protein
VWRLEDARGRRHHGDLARHRDRRRIAGADRLQPRRQQLRDDLQSDDTTIKGSFIQGQIIPLDFAADARAAAQYLRSQTRFTVSSVGFIGHSEGGLLAPMAADGNPDISYLVMLAGPGVPGGQVIIAQDYAIGAANGVATACPGGSLSNVITHHGAGNTALSVSISAVASLLALVLTPFHFSWMISTNPATASWLHTLELDPSGIWLSLGLLLAVPMALGLLFSHHLPRLTARLQKPLANLSLLSLLAFIVLGVIHERHLLTAQLLPRFVLVVLHNAAGLAFG